ncbi:MAG TPA: hypothetical protein VGH27_07110 [Streptosporangiaceae bacterium]
MRLRAHRQRRVVWSSSAPADSRRALKLAQHTRIARRRRYLRLSGWLAVIGLRRVGRGVRLRGRSLFTGAAFATIALGLHDGVWGVVAVAGLLVLMYALFSPASPEPDPPPDPKLTQELAGYSTTAQRDDLEATLDRYPDHVTHNLRDILSATAQADHT